MRRGYSGASTWIAAPPPYCKNMRAPLSKNVGIILYIDVKYTAYIFVHRCKVYCLHFLCIDVKYTAYIFVQQCKVYCLHFCASMHKNVASILYIDVEKCRQYTLHRCQKSIDVGSILYIDAQKCRQYTLHRCTKNVGSILYIVAQKCRQYTLHEPIFRSVYAQTCDFAMHRHLG